MNSSISSVQKNRQIHRQVLENGITLLVVENPSADIIAGRLFLRAGGRREQSQKAGLSHLVAAVLTKGTQSLSSLELAERVESIGASLSTDAAPDYFLLSLKTVSADFKQILALAAEILRSPTFPVNEVDLERHLALQAIRSQQEQPFTVALDQLRRAMYGNHPYALSSLGTEASMAQLDPADLQHYHQTYFRPDNLVISLAGRIDPATALAQVQQVFGDWQAPPEPLPTLELPSIASQPVRVTTPQDTQQSIIMLGYLTPAVVAGGAQPDPTPTDYVALKLLNTYLGNGLSSRLFVELREKRGLAYEVSAFYPTRLDVSQFVVYMGTSPENTTTALKGLHAEVDRLRQTKLSPDELQATQNKLLGQYALGKQTNAQIAQTYGWYETLGLGVDFDQQFQQQVAAISLEDCQAAAQRYLADPYISLVGPEAALSAAL